MIVYLCPQLFSYEGLTLHAPKQNERRKEMTIPLSFDTWAWKWRSLFDKLTSCLEFSCSRKLVNPTHLPRSPKFANISYLNERKLMYTPDVNDNDGLYLSFKNWNVKTHDHTYREKVKLKAGLTPGSTKLSICFWTLRVRRDGALLKPFIVNTGDLERMWITT